MPVASFGRLWLTRYTTHMYRLLGRSRFEINRFGRKFVADENGAFETDEEEVKDVFIAY